MLSTHQLISLLHIFIIGPILVLFGNTYGAKTNKTWFYYSALIIGLAMLAFHSYLVYKKGGIKPGFMYLLHAAIFAPVLIYIGVMGVANKQAFWGAYSVLIMIGFAAIGYHLLRIFK